VRKLACTTNLGSYAGSSLASGSATHVGQILSEVPDKDRCPGSPSWRLGVGLTSSPCKTQLSRNPDKRENKKKKKMMMMMKKKKKEEEKKNKNRPCEGINTHFLFSTLCL
jgi:hypothetical protein